LTENVLVRLLIKQTEYLVIYVQHKKITSFSLGSRAPFDKLNNNKPFFLSDKQQENHCLLDIVKENKFLSQNFLLVISRFKQ